VPECQDGQGQEKSASREIGKSAGWEKRRAEKSEWRTVRFFPAVAEKTFDWVGADKPFLSLLLFLG
jgi:hypothetical protein